MKTQPVTKVIKTYDSVDGSVTSYELEKLSMTRARFLDIAEQFVNLKNFTPIPMDIPGSMMWVAFNSPWDNGRNHSYLIPKTWWKYVAPKLKSISANL